MITLQGNNPIVIFENEQFHSEPKLFYILGAPVLFSPPSMDIAIYKNPNN